MKYDFTMASRRTLELGACLSAVVALLLTPGSAAAGTGNEAAFCPHIVQKTDAAWQRSRFPDVPLPPGAIDGSSEPDAIPDKIALTLLVKMIQPDVGQPSKEAGLAGEVERAGLEPVDIAALETVPDHRLEELLDSSPDGERLRTFLREHVKPRTIRIRLPAKSRWPAAIPAPNVSCPGGQGGLAPYCRNGCGPSRPCDKLCRADDETCITCGDYGNCGGGGGGGGGDEPPPDVYTSFDAGANAWVVWGSGSIATTSSAPVRVDVRLTSPTNRIYTDCSGCGNPWRGVYAQLSSELGEWTLDLDYYWCYSGEPIMTRTIRMTVGMSLSCWEWTGYRSNGDCAYDRLRTPCDVNCAPEAGVVTHAGGHGGCPPSQGYIVNWFKVNNSGPICSPAGAHTDIVPCICGDISVQLRPER